MVFMATPEGLEPSTY